MKSRVRNDIQGLRAVAVVLVILFHLPIAVSLRGGFVGVDMFYVISGFVVTKMVLSTDMSPGHTLASIGNFLRRRVMRLVPALSVVVIATVIISILFAPTQELREVAKAGVFSELFVSNAFYAQNFNTYWNPEVLRSPFLHTWSLGVEFQTYLLFPLIFIAVFRAGHAGSVHARSALTVTAALAVVSLVAFVYLLVFRTVQLFGIDPQAFAFYSPFTRFWEFALGILPAIVASRYEWHSATKVRSATPVAWTLIAVGVVGCTVGDTLNLFVIPACLGVATLLANGERAIGLRRSLLEWKPLVWIGDRSYSIYLWHWPLLVLCLWLAPGNLALALASIAATVGLSMLTYRFVEQQFRRSASTSKVRALLPSGAFVLVGVLVAGLGVGVASTLWYTKPVAVSAAATDFVDAGVSGEAMRSAIEACAFGDLTVVCTNDPDAGTVVVIGDSLADRSMPAVQVAAKANGLNATMMWTGGCGIEAGSCPDAIYDYLAKTDVVALIVSMNYDRESNRLNATEAASGKVATCPANEATSACAAHVNAVEAFIRDADRGLTEFEAYTDHVLIALPFPQQSQFVETCLSRPLYQRILSLPVDLVACGRTSVQWQSERQGLFPEAIADVAAQHPDVTVWNPISYLCGDEWCPGVINEGEIVMSDGIHWTWEASRFFYPVFEKYLGEID